MGPKVVGLPEPTATDAEVLSTLTRAATKMLPTGVAVDPRDVAHDAFLRVRDRIAAGESLGTSYLWRVAYTALIDRLRSEAAEQRRRRTLVVADESPGPSPEDRAAGAEIGVAIQECVDALPTDRKQAVVLHLQGHGVKDAATLLSWPYKRVENLIHRGVRALRACLEGKGFSP